MLDPKSCSPALIRRLIFARRSFSRVRNSNHLFISSGSFLTLPHISSSEKFRIWDKEEEESMLETPVRTNPWRTKSRVLVGDLSPVSPRKRRKPTVVKVVSEQGRKADSPVSSGIFPRSRYGFQDLYEYIYLCVHVIYCLQ